jgi:hypothetical protein
MARARLAAGARVVGRAADPDRVVGPARRIRIASSAGVIAVRGTTAQ